MQHKQSTSANEESAIQAIEQITIQQVKQHYQAGEKPARRDAHAKHHGCVKGEFIVESNLPEKTRFGIFQEPGKKFTACIRYSNGSGNHDQPDTKGDPRGMAIKLFGVEGEKLLPDEKKTQDLIVVNYPVFPIRNLQDYIDFFVAIRDAKGGFPLKFFIPSYNPFQWRLREFIISLKTIQQKIVSPLEIQYWSMTPYKLGNEVIKFSAKPSVNINSPRKATNPNYLREAMVEYLSSKEVSFDFLVQFQTDADKMPIEDARIEWTSPFHKVATIKIPPQTFDSPEQMEFCENLSYTPWHSLPEHEPLGAVNRARKPIYQAISKLRHDLNGVSKLEPTEEEFSAMFGHLKK